MLPGVSQSSGGLPHLQPACGLYPLDGNNRWFLQDYSFTFNIDQDAGRSQVYTYIHGKNINRPLSCIFHLFQ